MSDILVCVQSSEQSPDMVKEHRILSVSEHLQLTRLLKEVENFIKQLRELKQELAAKTIGDSK